MKKTSNFPSYSVLMSVYQNDRPEWLKIAITSILEQTIPPAEFVIVEDGPIPNNLKRTIAKFEKSHPNSFKIVKLPKNQTLGPALNRGIENCTNEYIARMDADDYSVPTRIEQQFEVFQRHPKLALVGSNVLEFENDIEHPVAKVELPEQPKDILAFAKRRCPLRHPSLLYKKSAVEKAGNYRACYLCEDYDLYIRMLQNGAKFYNIQEPLTFMRIDQNFYKRRGGFKYLTSILKFKKEQVRNGFFTRKDFIISSLPHVFVCLLPNNLRTVIYKRLLRKKPSPELSLPIKVLQIVPNMQAGGLETFIMNVYRKVDRQKIHFDFLTHYKKPQFFDAEIRQLGGKIYRFSLREDHKLFKYIRELNHFYKKHPEYKIVHCHMNSIGFIHFLVAIHNGVKVRISHSHNTKVEHTPKGMLKASLIQLVKYVSTHDYACSEEAGKYLFGSQPFTIVPNAIDVKSFKFSTQKRNKFRKQYNLQKKTAIGHIGRFDKQKNHKYIIDAFEIAHSKNSNVSLLLAGTGKLEPQIKEYVAEKQLTDSVIFLGTIKNTAEFYCGIDIFILPSLFEGIPVTAIEAQTSGVKCILSNKISPAVKIAENIIYLPITKFSKPKWAKEMLSTSQDNRNTSYKTILKTSYNIDQTVSLLQTKYFEMLNQSGRYEKC